jgi:hypothetical protein
MFGKCKQKLKKTQGKRSLTETEAIDEERNEGRKDHRHWGGLTPLLLNCPLLKISKNAFAE